MIKQPVFKSALALVLFVACLGLMGDAAGKDPEWSYDNDTDVDDVDISNKKELKDVEKEITSITEDIENKNKE